MWPVDPTTGWVAIDREGRGDAGVTVAFGVVHESAETLLPLVGLRAEALAADVRETQSCDCLWLMLVDDFGILGGKRVAIRQTMWNTEKISVRSHLAQPVVASGLAAAILGLAAPA